MKGPWIPVEAKAFHHWDMTSMCGLPALGPVLMALLSCVFCVDLGQAQPSLQNAVLTDQGVSERRRARADSFEEVEGVEAGPVQFSLSGSYSLEFNDNVDVSESNPEGDLIQTPAISLQISVPISERSDLDFQIGVGYQVYWHNENLSRPIITPGSELAFDLQLRDVSITLFDRFNFTQDVSTAPDVANQAVLPRFDNTIGTQITWVPDKWLVAGGYSYRLIFSTEEAYDYINQSSHQPFLRGGYVFSGGAANAGVELSATLTDYESNLTSDSGIVSFGPYLDWQLSDAVQASVRGGFLYTANGLSFLPDDSFDANSFYLGLNGSHALSDYFSHSLDLDHGVRPSLEQGVAFTEETRVNYRFSWFFMEYAVFSLDAGYIHGQQTIAAGLNPAEVYSQWLFGCGLSYEITTRLSCSLDYHYVVRDSNIPNRGYSQNRVTLGLNFRFERAHPRPEQSSRSESFPNYE